MNVVLLPLLKMVTLVLNLLFYAIFLYVILSWLLAFNVVNPRNQFVATVNRVLTRIIEPLCAPLRRALPDLGAVDLAPVALCIILIGLQELTHQLTALVIAGAYS